jgi:RNA polymerase sigma factor (sigma-70 family)
MGAGVRKLCQRIARRLLAQKGWGLVSAEDETFVESVLTDAEHRLAEGSSRLSTEKVVERAVTHRYCEVLYTACRMNGTPRQRQAFEELWRYLYGVACYRVGGNEDLAEECAQRALVKVWEKLDQCRDPGSFLKYAAMILLNEVRAEWKKGARRVPVEREWAEGDDKRWERREWSEAEMSGGDEREGESILQAGQSTPVPMPEDEVLREDIRTQLVEIVKECVNSARQQAVIIELFLRERGVKEVAELLDTTPSNVYTLKSRALAKLRKCSAFWDFVEQQLD